MDDIYNMLMMRSWIEAIAMDSKVQLDQPLSCDIDRVTRAYAHLLVFDDGTLLKTMSQENPKNAVLSEGWRLRGNEEAATDKDRALGSFSRSIALAPPNSKELGLGYLNRAAALFSVRRYVAALRDVVYAGANGLPADRCYKLEEQRARCLHALGSREAAQNAKKEALRLLSEAGPSVPADKSAGIVRRLVGLSRQRQRHPVAVTNKQLPGLVGGVNPKVPGLSANIELKFSKEQGRHLKATKDIKAGDVLAVEKPLAAMLSKPFFTTHCCNCLKRCLNMIPCRDCSLFMFCSDECLEEGWNSYHRVECRMMPHLDYLNEHGEQSMTRHLSLRLLLITCYKFGGPRELLRLQQGLEAERRRGPEAKRIFEPDGSYNPGSLRATYYLPRFYLGRPGALLVPDLAEHTAKIMHCLTKLTNFTGHDPRGHLARFLSGMLLRLTTVRLSSNFGVGEQNAVMRFPIGNAVYAVSSLINHSCCPNSFQVNYNGSVSVLVALRPILAGEEITVSYSSLFSDEPRGLRKMKLLSNYNFECRCPACVENWPMWKEPKKTRTDFTIKCSACGGTFEGPVHRSFVKCAHCSHRVEMPLMENFVRLLLLSSNKTEGGDLEMVLKAVREIHNTLTLPNDMLVMANQKMMECFARKGNNSKDSW